MGQPLTLRAALPGLGRLVRRLWPYVRRERPLIVVSLLALYAEIGLRLLEPWPLKVVLDHVVGSGHHGHWVDRVLADRKSTRLNSSHSQISYAVFCLKKKKNMM